jgi:hypothetical protein
VRFEKKFFYHEKTLQPTTYNAGVVVLNSDVVGLNPGANPTIVSYNASAVKFYKATNSIPRFCNKNYFSLL